MSDDESLLGLGRKGNLLPRKIPHHLQSRERLRLQELTQPFRTSGFCLASCLFSLSIFFSIGQACPLAYMNSLCSSAVVTGSGLVTRRRGKRHSSTQKQQEQQEQKQKQQCL